MTSSSAGNGNCLAGTCKYDADWFREQVSEYCDEVIVTEDHGQTDAIAKVEPSYFGTQMERHVGKRLISLRCNCCTSSHPELPIGYKPS